MAFGLVALWPNGLKLSKQFVPVGGTMDSVTFCISFDLTLNECYNYIHMHSFDHAGAVGFFRNE